MGAAVHQGFVVKLDTTLCPSVAGRSGARSGHSARQRRANALSEPFMLQKLICGETFSIGALGNPLDALSVLSLKAKTQPIGHHNF